MSNIYNKCWKSIINIFCCFSHYSLMKLLSPRCDHTLSKKDYIDNDSDNDSNDEDEYEYENKIRLQEKRENNKKSHVIYLPDFDHIVIIK